LNTDDGVDSSLLAFFKDNCEKATVDKTLLLVPCGKNVNVLHLRETDFVGGFTVHTTAWYAIQGVLVTAVVFKPWDETKAIHVKLLYVAGVNDVPQMDFIDPDVVARALRPVPRLRGAAPGAVLEAADGPAVEDENVDVDVDVDEEGDSGVPDDDE